MSSQASQIAKKIAALKRGLQDGKQDPSVGWRSLETLIAQAGKPKELWKDALTKDVLQDLVDAATSTFQKDQSGTSSTSVGNAIGGIWAALQPVAAHIGPPDIARINAFAEGTIHVAETWWLAYKDSIPSWKKQGAGVYEAKSAAISSALGTMQSQAAKIPSANRAGLKTLLATAPIQELVIAEMALGYDSSNDSQYDQSFYRLTSLSFAIFERIKITDFPSVVENPSSLARRFNRSADPNRAKVEDLTRVIADVLRTDDNLCITVASGMWKWYEECGIMPIPVRNKRFARIASVVAQLLPGKPEQMATRFPSVMREHDFISVIIKVLFAFGKLEGPLDSAPGPETQPIWKHWDNLKTYITSNPALFKAPLQPILKGKLLGALDIIRCNRGPSYAAEATKYMEELGTFADLKEADLRKAAIEERQEAQGGIVGCSWYRCVLYRQATDQVMHWCAGCRKVVYCGFLCQSRDWEEGHKDQCQGNS
ncbi:hypothetical protein FRC04_008560 [Tulasnella sp. 424]|nr:hypothetical protein FRC04_008560 [Tulasnella sp. 424]